MKYPLTPDDRYFVVRGRLWRCTDPRLGAADRERLTKELMSARRSKRTDDPQARERARQRVDAAKHALGERGPVWWDDGAPDYGGQMVHNTPYADWYASIHLAE